MDFDFNDFLSFKKMITPTIIKIIFWIGMAGAVIGALVMMGSSFGRYGSGIGGFFGGLIALVVGPVIVRVYCELLILLFRMNDTLTEINKNLKK